mgnify:CR=1 FL=1
MNVLDLFSGIGGFSLGLERAGMRTVAFCEIEPFCRQVLAKHWPSVPCYDDVRTLTADHLRADGISVDVICGGFPCQDISVAGKGAGIDGSRSGLWSEYARIIGELRPRYVIVENVAALLNRGLDRVLGDLAAIGFDAEWNCIPASAVGAPHRRDRLWIVAYPHIRTREPTAIGSERASTREAGPKSRRPHVADPNRPRLERWIGASLQECTREWAAGQDGAFPDAISIDDYDGRHGAGALRQQEPAALPVSQHWFIEPDVGRVANGIPGRVDRLRSLGNAVVPQIPEIIGAAILDIERSK